MFTASLIRLEPVGKTAESGNWHVLFYLCYGENVNLRSGSAITVAARTFWNPLRTMDATTGRPSYRCGRHRDFLSLVLERIEVRVINLRKAAYKHDSTPHLPLSSIEDEKWPNRPFVAGICSAFSVRHASLATA
jgi:hypothetical protein